MRDFDEEDEGRPTRRRAPSGRVYVHTRCGGQTRVSGGDFSHICDPFWPCTGTYCCTCAGFAPLHEVHWADTDEPVSEYRARLRAETPGLVMTWRYGVGFLIGGALGAAGGLLAWAVAGARPGVMPVYALMGGLGLGAVSYFLGTFILNRVYGIDYRRER